MIYMMMIITPGRSDLHHDVDYYAWQKRSTWWWWLWLAEAIYIIIIIIIIIMAGRSDLQLKVGPKRGVCVWGGGVSASYGHRKFVFELREGEGKIQTLFAF
jgi:hypothetical protein